MLAQKATKPIPFKVWTEQNQMSLSGPCSAALRAIQQGADPAAVALGTEQCIAQGLANVLLHLCKKKSIQNVYLCGGVSANKEIRRLLQAHLATMHVKVCAGAPSCSVDGAIGNAWLGVQKVRNFL